MFLDDVITHHQTQWVSYRCLDRMTDRRVAQTRFDSDRRAPLKEHGNTHAELQDQPEKKRDDEVLRKDDVIKRKEMQSVL